MSRAEARTTYATRCAVCDSLSAEDLASLDVLMGDPSRWPRSMWGELGIPEKFTPQVRVFGAVALGVGFLAERGINLSKETVRRHYAEHVPIAAPDYDALVERGVIAVAGETSTPVNGATLNPYRFLEFYNKGLEVGMKGLELLLARIETYEHSGETVPDSLLKLALDTSKALALSQANIRAKGQRIEPEESDEDFRAASAPKPSERMGHARVRVIEGERRAVTDSGRADRKTYNKRARQEGAPVLPE